MIQSMTGFGKHVKQLPSKKITIEIKSLNSKSLDLNVRIPSAYREKELELRRTIASSLVRGKVDFGLYIENTGLEAASGINEMVVRSYMEQLGKIASGDEMVLLEIAMRMPDTMKTEREDIDEEEYKIINEALEIALLEAVTFRTEEGKVLEDDFKARIAAILKLLDHVSVMDGERLQTIRERLEKAVADLKVELLPRR